MKIIAFSLQRRVTVAMAALAVSLFGAVAFTRLPINLLPDLTYPSLTIETRYDGAAPPEIEALVTRPIEEAVGVVAGVQRLTSTSRPGLSQVTLEFGWGRDMDFAGLDVRQKLDLVVLPQAAAKPLLLRFDPANDPIARLYLRTDPTEAGAETVDLFQLRYLGEEVLKKDLESTEGLAAIKVHGGYEEEVQVQVDEGKLALIGLSIDHVRDTLARENVNQAGGSLYEKEARYLVRARNEFQGLEDILATVVHTDSNRVVTLGDVATVERGHKQREVITRFGDETGAREAVELALFKEGDANTVSVSRAINARLETLRDELPPGVTLTAGVDQSRFIQASIQEVLSNALVGGGIAILVLLLFLKDARATLIIGISIPLSVVTTFFLMYRTGTSLNIMSLGGLALGIGMLVDNAIVVLEAIHKRREAGAGVFEAARDGASEVGRAVVASTLTTVAVFLPVVFLEGVAAQLFRDQALTVSFSLIASLLVSLTLIPMLAVLLNRGESGRVQRSALPDSAGRVRRLVHFVFVTTPTFVLRQIRRLFGAIGWLLTKLATPIGRLFDAGLGVISRLYPRLLRWSLGHRFIVLAAALLALVGAASLVPSLGLDLIPTISQGEFGYRVALPEGTPLESTDRYLASVQSVLDGDTRVESYAAISGGAGLSLANTGTEGENVGRLQVRLAPGTTTEDEAAVAALLRQRLAETEQARFKFERPSVFTLRTPVEVEIYGDQFDELHVAASDLKTALEDVPGLVDVKSSAELGNPELQVTFNRAQLVQLGLDLGQVAATVRNKVQGDVATRLSQGDREIDIVVRSVALGAASVDDVGELILGQRNVGGSRTVQERTQTGVLVDRQVSAGRPDSVPIRLKLVADVTLAEGPAEIRRIGQKRAAVIAGNLSGRDMGAVATDVRTAIDGVALPLGTTAVLGGQQEEMARSLRSLLLAMGLAIFLVYLVMASQFESFLHPFVIIFTLPLGAIGVIGALALTGQTINVVALIGAVMLAGIVVNNAIVLVDYVNRLRSRGLGRDEAIVAAGSARLRPILMTTATTVLGLMPMALGLGDGAEIRTPMAIAVISGLIASTVLTLLIVPAVYAMFDRLQARLLGRDPYAQAEPANLDMTGGSLPETGTVTS